MIDDRLQFALTQYLDGELPKVERSALEARLAADPEAQALLDEYTRLDHLLQTASPLPAINWDRLANRISDALEEQSQARTFSFRLFIGAPQLAVAASILLAIGLAFFFHRSPSPIAPASASLDVHVLQTDPVSGPSLLNVAIGPAPSAEAPRDSFVDGLVHTSSVVMIENGRQHAQDTDFQLY